MQVTVSTRAPAQTAADLLALPLPELDPEHWRLPTRWAALDRVLGGRISTAIRLGDFLGKPGQTLLLHPEEGASAKRVLLIGLGPEARTDGDALRSAAAVAVSAGSDRKSRQVALLLPTGRRLRQPAAIQALAEGAILGSYRFDRHRSSDDGAKPAGSLTLLAESGADLRALRAAVRLGTTLAECQNVARDLSNEPPNHMAPEALAREAARIARETGLSRRSFGPAELTRRKMGGILAVGGGSVNPPRLIVLEHGAPAAGKRGKKTRRRPTVALVGKGVTFDSGGLSLKPTSGMVSMKHDMSGGAVVIAAMRAVALLDLPLHVVGVVGAAENMPSGTAYRPSDIVRTASGKTVEIANTDAEGRVVLADALHHACSEYEPKAVIDVATLTGAVSVALGPWAAAIVSNHDRLAEALRQAGEGAGERYWPLPLWDAHREHMRGRVADLKQTGGRDASTITAAAFLENFVADVPWAHLDIASTADTERESALQPPGATGFGVRTLVEFLRGWSRLKLD